MHGELSQRALRVALVAAAAASLFILSGFLPEPAMYGCLGVVVVATLLAAGERRRPGGGWWTLLGAGAGLSVLGALVALAADTIGGLLAVVGGVLVVVGAAIGFPAGEETAG